MMGSDAAGSGLVIGEPRHRGAAWDASADAVYPSLSSLLIWLRLSHLTGVVGVLLVYRSHGPLIDLQFLSGVALMLAACILHRELRARLSAGLVRERRRQDDTRDVSVSEWAEREVDRLLWSGGDSEAKRPLPPFALN